MLEVGVATGSSLNIDWDGAGQHYDPKKVTLLRLLVQEVPRQEEKKPFAYWYAGGRLHVAGCTCSEKEGGVGCLKRAEEPQEVDNK